MALKPPIHREDRGGVRSEFPEVSPPGAPGEGAAPTQKALRDRVGDIDTTDWEHVGPLHRQMLRRNLRMFTLGKGALAEMLANLLSRRGSEFPDRAHELLAESARRVREHYLIFRELLGHLGLDDSCLTDCPEARLIQQFFRGAGAEHLTEADPKAPDQIAVVTLGYDAVLHAVGGATGYDAAMTMMQRNDCLEDIRELMAELRREDRARIEKTRAFLLERLAADDEVRRLLDSLFEQALLPSLEMIRTFREHVDFVSIGLVPDEFVASAIDRFVEFAELTNAGSHPEA